MARRKRKSRKDMTYRQNLQVFLSCVEELRERPFVLGGLYEFQFHICQNPVTVVSATSDRHSPYELDLLYQRLSRQEHSSLQGVFPNRHTDTVRFSNPASAKHGRPTRRGADLHPCALTKSRYRRGQRLVRLVLLAGAGGGGLRKPLGH